MALWRGHYYSLVRNRIDFFENIPLPASELYIVGTDLAETLTVLVIAISRVMSSGIIEVRVAIAAILRVEDEDHLSNLHSSTRPRKSATSDRASHSASRHSKTRRSMLSSKSHRPATSKEKQDIRKKSPSNDNNSYSLC